MGDLAEDGLVVAEEDVNKILLVLAMIFISCDDNSSQNSQSSPIMDMNPPTVSFMSPNHNETVEGSQTISIIAQDDQKVQEVDIISKDHHLANMIMLLVGEV